MSSEMQEQEIRKICLEILKFSDLNVLSMKNVRQQVAKSLGIPEDCPDLRKIVAQIVDEYLESFAAQSQEQAKEREKKPTTEGSVAIQPKITKSEQQIDLLPKKTIKLESEQKPKKAIKQESEQKPKKTIKQEKSDPQPKKHTTPKPLPTIQLEDENLSDSSDFTATSSPKANIKRALKSQAAAIKRQKSTSIVDPECSTSPTEHQTDLSSKASDYQIKKIDLLKSYIAKCGVHKIWKRELEGLSPAACITKLQAILQELGIEGRPSIEKCFKIKRQREDAQELHELDSNVILSNRLREHNGAVAAPKKPLVSASTEQLLNTLSVIADSE